jgi:hypothetical protein
LAEKKRKKNLHLPLDPIDPPEKQSIKIAIAKEEIPFWEKFGSSTIKAKIRQYTHRGPF